MVAKVQMIGKKFNRWTVINEAEKPVKSKQTGQFWVCKCECGSEKIVYGVSLRNGNSKSCGCLKSEVLSEKMKETRLKISGTEQERFIRSFKVNGLTGCWEWSSYRDKDGYGTISLNYKSVRAHRYSYEFHSGKSANGFLVCHSCDNPGCVNPDHLFIGSAKDNTHDMINKNRDTIIGEKNCKAKLKDQDIINIRNSNKTTKELMVIYGLTKHSINNIKAKRTWKHL